MAKIEHIAPMKMFETFELDIHSDMCGKYVKNFLELFRI